MTVILWARSGSPTGTVLTNSSTVVLWQAFLPEGAPAAWRSVPQTIMDRRDNYVARFRGGLHDLGVIAAPHCRVDDIDYWWLTLPADYSLEPDSPASLIVRLLALGDIAASLGADHVEVHGADSGLRRMLEAWARGTGHVLAFVDDIHTHLGWRQRTYRRLPFLAGLRALVAMWPSPTRRGLAQDLDTLPPDGIVVIDYLAQLRRSSGASGDFASGYWGPLVETLRESGASVTWLHNCADFATRAVVARDEDIAMSLDRPEAHERHLLAQSALTTRVGLEALRTWFRIRSRYRGVRRQIQDCDAFGFDTWPVIEPSMRDCILGRTALINAVWISQFYRIATCLPRQAVALLLLEGQPWELAFARAWRNAGHGKLMGFSHAALSPWNTRLLQDARSASMSRDLTPDAVIVCGPRMRHLYREAGFHEDRLHDAEALRFMHLTMTKDLTMPKDLPAAPREDRVLVLGEYSESLDAELRTVVDSAIRTGSITFSAFYRAHPTRTGVAIESSFKRDESAMVQDSLARSRAAVCGPTTSTALESAAMGVLTFVVPDPRALNASPAEGLARVTYTSSGAALARALAEGSRASRLPQPDVMWTDEGIPRWRALVASWLA